MKKWLSVLLCFALLAAAVPAFGETTDLGYPIDFSEEPYEVRMTLAIPAAAPAEEQVKRISEKVSELTLRDLNMTLKLEILTYPQYFQTIPLELATKEKLDIFAMQYGDGPQYALSGYVVDLNPLLDTYGPHMVGTYSSEATAKVCSVGDFLIGLPAHKENNIQKSLIIRTDMLEKYQIDPAGIKTLDDVNAAYETIAAGEPGLWMVTAGKSMNIPILSDNSIGVSSGACLMGVADEPVVTNLFATEEYASWLHLIRGWYEKGWVNPAAATDEQAVLTFLMGQSISYLHGYAHPLTESEIENVAGFDVTLIPLSDQLCTSASCAEISFAVSAGSKAPEKAVMMLDYLMTQPAAANLLVWGVEGEDYVEKDGLLDYPEGVDPTAVYHFGQGWMIPNQFITTPWVSTGKDVYEQVIAYNANAKESVALGFNFDPAPVMNELAAIGNVQSEYFDALNTGSVDPDEYLPEFLQALDDAGMQTVLDEVQRQLDAFLDAKK